MFVQYEVSEGNGIKSADNKDKCRKILSTDSNKKWAATQYIALSIWLSIKIRKQKFKISREYSQDQ